MDDRVWKAAETPAGDTLRLYMLLRVTGISVWNFMVANGTVSKSMSMPSPSTSTATFTAPRR